MEKRGKEFSGRIKEETGSLLPPRLIPKVRPLIEDQVRSAEPKTSVELGPDEKERSFHSRIVLSTATTTKRSRFHKHERLPYTFELEAKAASLAARRAKTYIQERNMSEQTAKEQERTSRWYYHHEHHSAVKNPQILAKKRVKKRKAELRKQDEAEKRRTMDRWYSSRPALEAERRQAIVDHANAILKHKRQEELRKTLGRKQAEDHRKEQVENVLARANQALAKAKKDKLEDKLLLGQQPPFLPGPYFNPIESSYAIEDVAKPRRFFSSDVHSAPPQPR